MLNSPVIGGANHGGAEYIQPHLFEGADLIHNHPSGWMFSPEDFRFAAAKKLNSIWAVLRDGPTMVLEKGEGAWPTADEMEKAHKEIERHFEALSPEQRTHQAWSDLANSEFTKFEGAPRLSILEDN